MLTVEGKQVGQKKKLFSDWQIPLPPQLTAGSHFTLRDLLTHIVHQEVEAFQARQEKRRLEMVLTTEQIEEGVQKGKVDLGGREGTTVDVHQALEAALVAFQDGFYFVFVDDQQQENLDAPLYLQDNSHVMFVRLVPLAGG